MEDGSTKEEWKMAVETRKILDPDIVVHATCVRVPVFIGHAEAVTVEFAKPITVAEARAALRDAPGVVVVDQREDGGYITPLECVGEDAVFVSRIRKDPTVAHGLSFWCVSDNLRKGAALNAVQIAEDADCAQDAGQAGGLTRQRVGLRAPTRPRLGGKRRAAGRLQG